VNSFREVVHRLCGPLEPWRKLDPEAREINIVLDEETVERERRRCVNFDNIGEIASKK